MGFNPCGEIQLGDCNHGDSCERKQVTMQLVARYLYDACSDIRNDTKTAVNYICERIVNGDYYKGNVQFEDIIRKYKQSGKGLEESANQLIEIVGDCDKWLVG